MRQAIRLAALVIATLALSSVASAYYYWTFFPNRSGPFLPIPAKYDLTTLPGKTVYFFISEDGPSALVPGDSITALTSQIRAAADVWNRVPTSDLRLKFGGISTIGALQNAAGIDVVFDDNMPPGLLAQTRLTFPDDLSSVANGAKFVPIQRARVQLRRDLSASQQASYDDQFFTTLVHEFGHTLGLQHTLTSSVMSTSLTRGTSKAQPLAADDVAGISLLYPTTGWAATTGTIQGHVMQSASGVNMASVVALSLNGTAVSALTNPDGSYQISGLPQGKYYVYVHPLPPAQQGEATPGNIIYPVDWQKIPFPANIQFDSQFFPATRDWNQATLLRVDPGVVVDGIDFFTQKRTAPAIYAMQTTAYQGADGLVPVPEPPLVAGSRSTMVFTAVGTTQSGRNAQNLNISAIGTAAQVESGSLTYYGKFSGVDFQYMTVSANATVSAMTPVSLAVTTPTDLYVLPAAFSVVPVRPPSVTSVTSVDGVTAVLTGANLTADTRVMFDGAVANVVAAVDGSLTVSIPPGPAGHSAVVAALSNDGQSSTQALGKAAPAKFPYTSQDSPFIMPKQLNLVAGTDSLVDIQGFGTTFLEGQVTVGFGSSDIVVNKVWVANSGLLRMNVTVNPLAQPGTVTVTTVSGLQLTTLTSAVQIQPYTPRTTPLRTPITNLATGFAAVPIGGTAVIGTGGLPANLTGWILTIDGGRTDFSFNSAGQLLAQVPAGASQGVAVVQLNPPSGDGPPPVLMKIDPPPPVVTSLVNGTGVPNDAAHAAQIGDTIVATVAGLTDGSVGILPSQIRVTIAGIEQQVQALVPGAQVGSIGVKFTVTGRIPAGSQQPLTVGMDTRVSAAVAIAIRGTDAERAP